ncbi:ABC transporter permease [Halocatena halophila]|uniref:ABC transporter permease n=1 Tax=Halocatena halophila TaxID=2814576 RepID=UPI002ED5CA39
MVSGRFLARRLGHGVVVVWAIVTVVFLLRYSTPGSVVTTIAPLDASPQLKAEIAKELSLHEPIYVQYAHYLGDLLRFDLGHSYVTNTPVRQLLASRLPQTLDLAIAATIVAITIAIPLGVVSATRRHTPTDYAATSFSLVGISTPNFWLGLVLVLVFAVGMGWFPVSGPARANGEVISAIDVLYAPQLAGRWLIHLTLPAVTLGTYFTALLTRLTRSGVLEELEEPYVRTLRSSGLPPVVIRYQHVLRNALVPVVTVLGLQLGTLIGGAVITERVFAWHGLGSLLIDAINDRDWMVVQGCLIVIGVGFVVINAVVDGIYAQLDPEVSIE